MQKFRTFVKECGVILIAFNDEVFPQRDGKTAGEILGDAANQKRWIEPRGVEDPGQHRGGRGLAVGAANHDRFARA